MKITPSRINTLLTIGENLNIEFKRAGDGPKADTFESVCAFLNKAGGDLLLGVDDDGTVVGLPPKSVDAMIRNFVKVMNDPNLFEPVFDEDDVFRLTVPLDDAYSADRALTEGLPQTTTAQDSVLKGGMKSGMKSDVSGMKTADAIIALMRADSQITHDILAARLGKARNSIIKQIAKLKKNGLIRRVGPDKGGHWEVIG